MRKFLFVFTVIILVFNLKAQNLTISGGNNYSLVICGNGTVSAWGNADNGQLGLDALNVANTSSSVPIQLFGLPEVFQVDAGSGSHALALTCDNRIVAWGNNSFGQLGNTSLPLGGFSADPVYVENVGGGGEITGVKFVSGGNDASYAITFDDRAISWGWNGDQFAADGNNYGTLGTGDTDLNGFSNVPQYVQKLADIRGVAGDLQGVKLVEAGDGNGYALTIDGYVYSWGDTQNFSNGRPNANNEYAGLVVDVNGNPIADISSISAGDRHVLAIASDGTMYAWGGDWGPGQIGDAGEYFSQPYATKVASGQQNSTSGELEDVISIAAGQSHSMAVTSGGSLYTWGANTTSPATTASPFAMLGAGCSPSGFTTNGNAGVNTKPVLALTGPGTPLTGITGVSDGDFWTFALDGNGDLWVAGVGANGELGLGAAVTTSCYFQKLTVPNCNLTVPCPEPNLGTNLLLCPNFSHELDAGPLYPGFEYTWYLDGVEFANYLYPLVTGADAALPPIANKQTVTEYGVYRVEIEDKRPDGFKPCEGCPDAFAEITISAPEADFSDPGTLEFCGTDVTVNVSESGNAVSSSNNYEWYTALSGGTQLGTTIDEGTSSVSITGVTLTGTEPNRVGVVYVEDVSSFNATVTTTAEVGASGNLNNRGGGQSRLNFSVAQPVTLNSLDVFTKVYNVNARSVGIYRSTGVLVGTFTVTPTSTNPQDQRLTYTSVGTTDLTIGNYYVQMITDDVLYQSNPGNGFSTFQANGSDVFEFTSASENVGFPSYTNWNVTAGSQYQCNRLPVTITENCPPCNKPESVVIGNGSVVNICDVTPAVSLDLEGTVKHGTNPVQDVMSYVWYKDGETPGAYTTLTTNTTTIVPPKVFTDPTLTDAGDWVLRVEDGSTGDATCYTEATVTLNVGEVPVILGENQTICSEESTSAINLSSSVSGGSFTWTRALGTNVTGSTNASGSNSTIPSATFTNSGNTDGTVTYTVIPTGTTPTSCVGESADYVVTVRPLPVVSSIMPQTICSEESTTAVTLASSVTGATFSWTSSQTGGITGMTALGTGDIPVQTLSTGTGSGGTVTYSIVPTNPGTPSCEGAAIDFVVTVNPKPTVLIGSGGTYCPEDLGSEVLTITPSDGAIPYTITYNSPTSTSQTITISSATGDITGLAVGDYTFTQIEDAKGCISPITNTVSVATHPALVVTPVSATCATGGGETATVLATISGGVPTYMLDSQEPTGGTATAGLNATGDFTATFDAAPAQSYKYVFSDATNCVANIDSIFGELDCDCPVIAEIDTSVEMCAGETATLRVSVSGRRGTGISNYSVTLSDGQIGTRVGPGDVLFTVSPTATTTYTITNVNDEICTGNPSGSALVTVLNTTVWSMNLDNTADTLCPGEPLNLQALALGENIMYEWFQGTTSLGSASSVNEYEILAVASSATGVYSVNVTGTCGDLISQTKNITVADEVAIITDLSTDLEDLCPGDALELEIEAEGTPVGTNTALTYSWERLIPLPIITVGLDEAIFNVSNVSKIDSGDYRVIVTGRCGSDTSLITPVKVSEEVAITMEPVGSDLCPGDPLLIEVEATGTPSNTESALTYTWTKTLPISSSVGLNQDSYEVSATLPDVGVTTLDAGSYQVSIEGRCNTANSVVIDVMVGITTEVTNQPDSVQICEGSNASFGVTALGDDIVYSWSHTDKDGVVSTVGTDDFSISIVGAVLGDAGEYVVQVTGTCGTVTSDIALLEITDTEIPKVTLIADKTTICEGDDVLFTATGVAGGDMPLFEFFDGLNSLQGPVGTNTFTLTDISEDVTIEVLMISNSECIDASANDSVRDSQIITVIDSAEASIMVDGVLMTPVDTLLIADEEVLDVTGVNATTVGSFIQNWTISSTTNIPQSDPTIISPSTLVTDLTGLSTKDSVTFLKIEIQDAGGVCPVSTDSFPVSPKDFTEPIFDIPDMCETDLAHIATGNEVLPDIETPTIISYSLVGEPEGVELMDERSLTIPVGTAPGDYVAGYQIFNSVSGETASTITNFTIYEVPSGADGGDDITTCTESVNLKGTAPMVGTGMWTCDAGTLTNPESPTALLSGLVDGGTVNCIWTTTSNVLCDSKTDPVQVTKQGDVTTPVILLDGEVVTGRILDICITDMRNLTASEPDASVGESAQWASVGTSVMNVNGTDPEHGIMSLQSVTPIQTVVSWTITSMVDGCDPEKRSLTLNVHDEPIAKIVSVSSNDMCQNSTPITIETAALGATDKGSWMSTSVIPSLETSDSINWSLDPMSMDIGNNTITYTVENLGCGPLSDDENINIEGMVTPTISLSPSSTLCVDSDFMFKATVSGEGDSPMYQWVFGDSTYLPTSSGILELEALEESISEIMVTLISDEKCKTEDPDDMTTLEVVPGPKPEIITLDDTICVNDQKTIYAEDLSGAPVVGYQWYRDGFPVPGEVVKDSLAGLSIEATYTLEAISEFCQNPISDPMLLTVNTVPNVDASVNGINQIEGFEGDELFLSGEHDGESAIWSNLGGINIIEDVYDMKSPIITEETGGIYTVILTVENGDCQNADTVSVRIKRPVWAPNVFTVNGDGYNETFHIKGLETFPYAIVTVYNRWGNKVYESLDYTNEEWDGGNSPMGAYYYTIDLGESDDDDDEFAGCVHLMR